MAGTEYVQAWQRWRDNSDLISNGVVKMGYIKPDDRVLDVTYGRGNWWKDYRPDNFYYHDIALDGVDFTDLPYEDEQFDVVAYDGPYKLNGTDKSSLDAGDFHDRFGLRQVANRRNRYQLLRDGLGECARVVVQGGHVLMKCQNQSQGAGVHWQTYDFVEYGRAECGLQLVDEFYMPGHSIKQQPGRRQKRAHGRPSMLLVFQKRKQRSRKRGS